MPHIMKWRISKYSQSVHSFSMNGLAVMFWLFPQRLKHFSNTLFLLLHVRVNIEVESCSYVSVAKQYTYGLIVAVAFNAASSKAVA